MNYNRNCTDVHYFFRGGLHMNIRHLRIFIEVAESGKMSIAAAKFYISQPSVSQMIRELETHYQTRLFERISQKLYITPNGRILLERARDIVARFDAMEEEMLHLSRVIPFRMGVTPYFDDSIVAEVMDSLNFRCPDNDFSVVSTSDSQIEQKLLSFDIDVGIMTGKSQNNDLINIPVAHDYLALICPKGHELYSRDHIRPEELDGQTFSLHEEGSYQRKMLDAMIHNCTINIHKRWESTSVSIIKKSVLKHNCLALTSALAFWDEIRTGQVHAYLIGDERQDLTIHLVYPKQKDLNKPLKALRFIFDHLDMPGLPPKESFLTFG